MDDTEEVGEEGGFLDDDVKKKDPIDDDEDVESLEALADDEDELDVEADET